MTVKRLSTRRAFIGSAGAALSVPLAAVAATAPSNAPAHSLEDADTLRARLTRLEDENAIRALNQAYVRHVNADAHAELAALFADPSAALIDPGIRGVTAEHVGEHDVITIAPDGQVATGLLHCTVDAESVIGPACPLLDMARQQGGGVVRRTERGVFENAYVKRGGSWKIQRATYRTRER